MDLDLDGVDEIRLVSPGQILSIEPAEGGGIGEWDVRAVRHALGSVLRRRPEAYHQKLLEAEARHTADAASAEAPREAGSSVGGPTHGAAVAMAVATKEAGLGSVLTYDGWERRSGLVHLHDQGVAPTDVATGRARGLVRPDGPCRIVELGDDQVRLERAATDSFRGLDASITTTIAVGGDRLTPTLIFSLELANRAATPLETRVGVSWDLMLLGGGGNPAAYHEIAGTKRPHDSSGTASAVSGLAAGNDYIGLRLDTTIEPAAEAWWASIDTVSNSEGGFERIHQGSGMLLSWPVRIEPGSTFRASIGQRVTTRHDAAVDDGFRPG